MTMLAIASVALFSMNVEKKETHNLISQEKADAYELFENWIIKNSKKYREIEVKFLLCRKNHTDLVNSLKTTNS